MKSKTIKNNIQKIIEQDNYNKSNVEINFRRLLVFFRFFEKNIRFVQIYQTTKKLQLLKKLYYMFQYNIEIETSTNLDEKWTNLLSLSSKDSSSIEYHTIIYGQKLGKVIQENKSKKTAITVNNFINKVGTLYKNIEEAKVAYRNSRNGTSDVKFKEKFGTNWKEHKQEYLDRKRHKQSVEYLGEDEYNKRKEYHKYYNTKDGYIKKHGFVKGYGLWKSKNNNIRKSNKLLTHNRDNNSLPAHIQRYGIFKGNQIYKNLCSKQRQISIVNESYKYFGKNNGAISKISMVLYDMLIPFIDNIECEFKINRYYFDFKIGKTIIEFNGDYWHCNPMIYEHDQLVKFPNRTIPANTKWEEDKKKIKVAKDNGYDVIVIWEKDFRNNKQKVLQQLKRILCI